MERLSHVLDNVFKSLVQIGSGKGVGDPVTSGVIIIFNIKK